MMIFYVLRESMTNFYRAMLYDEKEYPDPESFKPERYINVGKNGPRNPVDVIFGFGRRLVLLLFSTCLSEINK